MAVEIKPSVLRQQVEDGMKLVELAEHYELPVAQMKRALKELGLTIRKFHKPKFVFVEEEEEDVSSIVNEEMNDSEGMDSESSAHSIILELEEVSVESEDMDANVNPTQGW